MNAIDCRPFSDYCAGHLQGAASLPATELFARMHELPKRSQALSLYGTAATLSLAQEFLGARGHIIAQHVEWTPALAAHLAATGQLETGTASCQLWQAAPLLQHFVNDLMPRYGIQPGKGLDIACGAGRDLIYLAQHGWDMTGVDWSEDSLQRVASLAQATQVKVRTLLQDLETEAAPLQELADGSIQLVCVARYLHRPLFPTIRRLLSRGGIVIYQTFMQGCEQTAIGRPRNPKFLLAAGELANLFHGFDIILDEVELLDDGRPVSAFVARRT